jgi:integrase
MRGNITRRGKHSWRIKFDLDREPSGERQVRYVTVKGTRKDAEAELTRLLNDADRGVLVDPTKITVAKHLHDWLDGKDGLSELKAHEVPAVLDALKGHRLYPMVALALSTGARRSELLALRWRDINLQRGVLRIEHSLEQTKAGLRLKSPKTKSGRRSISLPAFAVDMLNEHRKAQLELRLQLGMGKPESEALVFCNHDGSPISPNYFSIMWSRAVTRAGLPKRTFHSLRHSHASALIRAGLDVVRVSRQLGHSKPTITLATYAHEFEEADSGAADAIGKVLG